MRRFVLAHEQAPRGCAEFALRECPAGYEVLFREPVKKRAQEEKYHAMLGDIHKSGLFRFLGRSDWSRGKRRVPIHYCCAVEKATDGEVTRRELRPDDWKEIWLFLPKNPAPISPGDFNLYQYLSSVCSETDI